MNFSRAKNADGMEFAQRLSRRAARPVDCRNVLGIKSFIFHRDTTLINMYTFYKVKINILSIYLYSQGDLLILDNPLHIGVKRLHILATLAAYAGQKMLDRD
jgi:hypothetical protein